MKWPQLQGRYAPMLMSALFVLIPYILTTSAELFYRDQLVQDLHTSTTGLSIVSGLAVAGYAFGAFFCGDLINRFRLRTLYLVQCLALVLGWSLSAAGFNIQMYGAGQVLAAFATGQLLVTALPPVIRRFPAARLPTTVVFVNIAFFGAIAAGPLLGGIVHYGHAWRLLFAGFAAIDAIVLVVAFLALPQQEPFNRNLRFDALGLVLGFATTSLIFWASGELRAHGFLDPLVAVPLGIGAVCFIVLVAVEYQRDEPLAPVKKMWTTIPLVGTLIAMLGGGLFVSFVELLATALMHVENKHPLGAGLMFWPQVIGAVVAALLLGYFIRSRFLALFAIAGMMLLVAAGALLLGYRASSGSALILAIAGVLGLGAGATVSPALFLAGLPLQSSVLGRIFALIELVRSVADFIIAPVMVKIARLVSAGGGHSIGLGGFHEAVFITLMIAVAGTIISIGLLLAGGTLLPQPNLEAWIGENRPAIESPPLLSLLRRAD